MSQNEFTLIVAPMSVTIVEGRHSGARRFYAGRTLRYYVHGQVSQRRDAVISKMMSHAYERGETLSTLSKWSGKGGAE